MLKVASLFSQILAEIPRTDFEKPAAKHGTEGHAKGFRSWTRFVAILFCHLARAHLVTRDMPRSFQIWTANFISRCEKNRKPGFKSVQSGLLNVCRCGTMFSVSSGFGLL
jgi:hypothetical protein